MAADFNDSGCEKKILIIFLSVISKVDKMEEKRQRNS
jgi:hypothetical protein